MIRRETVKDFGFKEVTLKDEWVVHGPKIKKPQEIKEFFEYFDEQNQVNVEYLGAGSAIVVSIYFRDIDEFVPFSPFIDEDVQNRINFQLVGFTNVLSEKEAEKVCKEFQEVMVKAYGKVSTFYNIGQHLFEKQEAFDLIQKDLL